MYIGLHVQYNNYEQHRLDTTYYNLVIRYNLEKTPGYMFRPSFMYNTLYSIPVRA
jgi:hypothetical protein